METLGYVAYGVLCIFAIYFAVGVRFVKNITIFTVFASLFFTSWAIIIAVTDMAFINSAWVIPSGLLLIPVLGFTYGRYGIEIPLLRPVVNLYTMVLKIGIKTEAGSIEFDELTKEDVENKRKALEVLYGDDLSELRDEDVVGLFEFRKRESQRADGLGEKTWGSNKNGQDDF